MQNVLAKWPLSSLKKTIMHTVDEGLRDPNVLKSVIID